MPVAPETTTAMCEAIEAHRKSALAAYDRAAEHLDDIRARLRFAFGDVEPLGQAIYDLGMTAAAGGHDFQAMLGLAADLHRMLQAERAPLPVPVDLSGKLDGLVERLASTAEHASVDLDTFAGMLRGGPPSGSSDDVVQLAGTIQTTHQRLQDDLAEALQVASCAGSA